MSGDEDIAEIHGVDPTPIDHPVDDEAIASAVNATAAEVADHPGMDDHNATDTGTGTHEQGEKSEPNDGAGGDGMLTGDDLQPSDLYPPANKIPKKRARRVGKVPAVRKVPKLNDGALVVDPTTPTSPNGIEAEGAEPSATMPTEVLPRVLSKHDEKWNAMFKELLEYKEKHNTTNVAQCYSENHRLGRWVHYQRVEYWVFQDTGGGKITPERIGRLEAIGFEWDPQRAQWNMMFEKLQKFKAETGNCKVPKGYTKDAELANWVRNQRLEHANMTKGKKSRMTEERFKKLDDIGFKWSGTTAKGRTPAIPKATNKDSSVAATNNVKSEESTEPQERDPTDKGVDETPTDAIALVDPEGAVAQV